MPWPSVIASLSPSSRSDGPERQLVALAVRDQHVDEAALQLVAMAPLHLAGRQSGQCDALVRIIALGERDGDSARRSMSAGVDRRRLTA